MFFLGPPGPSDDLRTALQTGGSRSTTRILCRGANAVAWPAGDSLPRFPSTQGFRMDNTTDEERRHQGSRRARAHGVTTGQCPRCGAVLPAALAAAVKRGDTRCWR